MDRPHFYSALLELSDELSAGELDKIKFLCTETIGKKDREKIETGQKLFELLTERNKLGADNTDFLSRCLRDIRRPDLSDRLQFGSPENRPDETERAKLDIATEVIAENLGRKWRNLGRRLGLKDVKLDSISKRYPTELDETARELLKEWRESRGAEARTEELIRALRVCEYNMTADKVEDKLSEN